MAIFTASSLLSTVNLSKFTTFVHVTLSMTQEAIMITNVMRQQECGAKRKASHAEGGAFLRACLIDPRFDGEVVESHGLMPSVFGVRPLATRRSVPSSSISSPPPPTCKRTPSPETPSTPEMTAAV